MKFSEEYQEYLRGQRDLDRCIVSEIFASQAEWEATVIAEDARSELFATPGRPAENGLVHSSSEVGRRRVVNDGAEVC